MELNETFYVNYLRENKRVIEAWKFGASIVFIDKDGELVTDKNKMFININPETNKVDSDEYDGSYVEPSRQIINDYFLIYRVALAQGKKVQRYQSRKKKWRDLISTDKDRNFSTRVMYRILEDD